MPKPHSPLHDPSQEINPTTQEKHNSIPFGDFCVTNDENTPMTPQVDNHPLLTQTPSTHSSINPHVASMIHTQALPQGDNQTQLTSPPSPIIIDSFGSILSSWDRDLCLGSLVLLLIISTSCWVICQVGCMRDGTRLSQQIEQGFKDGVDSKKTGSKLSGLADKIKNIDGKISGKDGRPLKAHRVVKIACGVVETMVNNVEVSGVDGESIPVAIDNNHDLAGVVPSVDKTMPINVGTDNPSDNNPFAPTVPLNEKEDVIDIIGADVFSSKEGMKSMLKNGPWRIRYVPLILNIWNPKSELNKEDIKVPIWIKMFNVPIVAYSEVGLNLITSKLGRLIMLDAHTSNMCLNSWGLCSYARALVEISADNELLESLVVAIPLEKGMGHRMVSIGIEFEWKPPRCASCKIFDHVDKECLKKWEEVIRKQSMESGFVHAKPNTNMASTSIPKENNPLIKEDSNGAGNRHINANVKPTYIQDNIDLGQLSTNINKLMEEDKVFDINTEFGSDSVFETQDLMLTSSKSVIGDGKIQEKGSLWERFKEAKEASTSKPRSPMSDIEDESDEDEVYMPDDYKLNIFPRLVESLLWRTTARLL
ncbi:zinc knuckle CX2CX4HX4C containing protein [Tanacetum coccineum]